MTPLRRRQRILLRVLDTCTSRNTAVTAAAATAAEKLKLEIYYRHMS